jgi:hypothetical protein
MGSMLLGAAAIFYLMVVTGVLIGGNYLIEKNLAKQARHLMPVFDEISVPLFFTSGGNAADRLANYARSVPDIGVVRVYDKNFLVVMAEYLKPGTDATPRLDRLNADKVNAAITGIEVRRVAGVPTRLRMLAPIQIKTAQADPMDFDIGSVAESLAQQCLSRPAARYRHPVAGALGGRACLPAAYAPCSAAFARVAGTIAAHCQGRF